jgi:hypothetical protein
MIENIVSGVIGGLFVLLIQYLVEHLKYKKNSKNSLIVGNQGLKIIDKNFLYTYEPHKISIEKVIEDFGQPIKKYNDEFDDFKLELYQYNFQNAKVLFSKSNESSEIISITLFSTNDKKNPVLCRISFEDDDIEFGKAKINDTIIKESIDLENSMTQLGNVCIIKSKYFYRQIKHLTFSYEIGGNYESLEDTKDEIINQVCVSQMQNVNPMFTFYDTFYN